jgi:hypothetical protein
MRTRLIASVALLLGAMAAAAQPIGSAEITTAPIAKFGGYALGVDGTGFVYAWIEEDRVLVTRLDATLRNAPGAVPVAIPAFSAGSTLSGPAVATNGRSILISWRETVPGGGLAQNVYAGVAHDLSAVLQLPKLLDFSPVTIGARYAAGRYVLVTQWLYEIDDQLAVEGSRPAGAVSVMNETGDVATVALADNPECHGGWFGYCVYHQTVTVTTPHGVTQLTYGGYSRAISGGLALAPNGSRFALGWYTQPAPGVQPEYTFHDIDRPGNAPAWTLPTTTTDVAFAGNGSDIFVAWGTGTQSVASYIYGTILHVDGSQTPFGPVATAGQHPRVLAAPDHAFVLTYEIPAQQGTIIGGRVFRPAASRYRAVR